MVDTSKAENWLKQNKSLVFVAILAVMILGVASSTTTQTDDEGRQLYTANLDYTVKNDLLAVPEVTRSDVRDFNKQSYVGSIAAEAKTGSIFPASIRADISVTCDGSEVYFTQQKFEVSEGGSNSNQATLKNLPSGTSCSANIDLINEDNGNFLSRSREAFTVP